VSASEEVFLDQVAFFQEGPGVRKWQFTDEGIKLVNVRNIVNEKLVLNNTERFLSEEEVKSKYQHFLVDEGDLIMASSGVTWGKVAWVEEKHLPLCMNTSMIRFKSKDVTKLDKYYLRCFLKSNLFLSQMRKLITGSAQPNFGPSHLKQILISLPPLKEQKRIAAILDKADTIRRKRQQAIDLTDQLLRSVFLDMFGDPSFSMTVTELLEQEYLLLHKDGNHGGNYPRKEEFGNEGVPFISAKDISEEDGKIIQSGVKCLNEVKARKLTIGWLKNGDVLLAHNATVGRVGIFQGEYEEALIGTSLTAFRPNPKKLMSHYLFCALKYSSFQEQLKKNMGQSTRNQVPITAQKEMKIPIGDLGLQKKLTEYFDHLMKSKVKHLVYLDHANKCFNSLTQQAFRGELTKQTKAA